MYFATENSTFQPVNEVKLNKHNLENFLREILVIGKLFKKHKCICRSNIALFYVIPVVLHISNLW